MIMKRVNRFTRILAVALLLAMLLPTALPMGAFACDHGQWRDNVLIHDPLALMTKAKDKIACVTFLDSLEDVPARPWHLGKGSTRRVQGWVEWEGGYGYAYIAAEGGINGRYACEDLFEGCTSLVEVNFNGAFHTDEATSMANMFYGCESLYDLDVSQLNTANVTDMSQMFRDCKDLTELDVSNFDTSNVKSMYCMFSTCICLEELDLSNFDTSRVTNMGYMFSACLDLEYADVAGFDTSGVTNMEGMFRWCNSLGELDFSGWNVSRVRKYSGFMNSGMTVDGRSWERLFR